MRLDEFGNATEYHFLKNHPGDLVWGSAWDYERIPASTVIHWFRPDRPGQHRGIPELTPGLPLLAQLRRYCAATLGALFWESSERSKAICLTRGRTKNLSSLGLKWENCVDSRNVNVRTFHLNRGVPSQC